MNRTKRVVPGSVYRKSMSAGYLAALLAVGFGSAQAWGQGQAVQPVNNSGQKSEVRAIAGPQVSTTEAIPAAVAVAPAAPVVAVPEAAPVIAAPMARVMPGPVIFSPPPAPVEQGVPGGGVNPGAAGNQGVTPQPGNPAGAIPRPLPPIPAPTPVTPGPAQTQPASVEGVGGPVTSTEAIAQDGPGYPITGLKIDYKFPQKELIPIEDVMNTQVRVGVVNDGYVAPRAGVATVMIKLGDIGKGDLKKIYRSGVAAVYGQIVRLYNAKGLRGVWVVADAQDVDENDKDIRPPERTALQLIVVTSTVKNVRTVEIASGTNDTERVNNPKHAFIREHSPIQPAGDGDAGRRDLMRGDVLDEYVFRLNRYPGRHVDAAMSGTNELGKLDLDYLVSESRPWYVYAQVSNTGTSQTADWRERVGFVNNQLTGHDDIFSLEYLTAGFTASNAVVSSYEVPFFSFDTARYRVFASWNEYTASDVGQNNEQFTGDQWTMGNELSLNIFQQRELFVDVVGGFKFQGITSDNVTSDTHGEATYFEPYLGLRLDRATDIATTVGSLNLIGYVTGADLKEIEGLGRADPTRNPVVLQFEFYQSFFLEPLVNPQSFALGKSTLAHEVAISMRGQYAFNSRLFPQAQDVAGGLYSVRGYPESIVAGDSLILGTAEYRLHVPRLFPVQPDPTKTPFLWDKNFRAAPQQTYGRPDWDLILRAFVDVGEVVNSSREEFEHDATLVGMGLGVEFQYRQNFNLRVDWGTALTSIPDEVKSGSSRFHISTTFLY